MVPQTPPGIISKCIERSNPSSYVVPKQRTKHTKKLNLKNIWEMAVDGKSEGCIFGYAGLLVLW